MQLHKVVATWTKPFLSSCHGTEGTEWMIVPSTFLAEAFAAAPSPVKASTPRAARPPPTIGSQSSEDFDIDPVACKPVPSRVASLREIAKEATQSKSQTADAIMHVKQLPGQDPHGLLNLSRDTVPAKRHIAPLAEALSSVVQSFLLDCDSQTEYAKYLSDALQTAMQASKKPLSTFDAAVRDIVTHLKPKKTVNAVSVTTAMKPIRTFLAAAARNKDAQTPPPTPTDKDTRATRTGAYKRAPTPRPASPDIGTLRFAVLICIIIRCMNL